MERKERSWEEPRPSVRAAGGECAIRREVSLTVHDDEEERDIERSVIASSRAIVHDDDTSRKKKRVPKEYT